MNPVEMLCYMGKRAMGALEFRPAARIERGTSYFLEISELVALAQRALNRKNELSANIWSPYAASVITITITRWHTATSRLSRLCAA